MVRRQSPIEYRNELRERVLAVAINMFREKGIKAVKMDDIAHALGISKRTLYEIYPNKEDLLIESFKAAASTRRELMKKKLSEQSDVMDILTEFFRLHLQETRQTNPIMLDEVMAYPRVVEFMEGQREQHAASSREFFFRGQEEGFFRKDVNLEIMGKLENFLSDAMVAHRMHKDYPADEILKSVIMLFLRGICTIDGIKRIDELIDSLSID